MKKHFGLAVAALALLGAQNAHAYDFKVGHKAINSAPVTYAHVVVASAFCHDRSPVNVAAGDAPLTYGNYVSDSTAPGCLISKVAMEQGSDCCASWTSDPMRLEGAGQAGGTFTMMWGGGLAQYLYVCWEDTACQW